jgi:hypothetical protein
MFYRMEIGDLSLCSIGLPAEPYLCINSYAVCYCDVLTQPAGIHVSCDTRLDGMYIRHDG